MKIRIYYDRNGIVTGIVIIDNDDWDLVEHIKDINDNYTTFDLTKENIEKYMESADSVNLEAIQEAEIEGVL